MTLMPLELLGDHNLIAFVEHAVNNFLFGDKTFVDVTRHLVILSTDQVMDALLVLKGQDEGRLHLL